MGTSGKNMSRDECEQVIGNLFFNGLLSLEMGYTAYATNAYIKLSQKGSCLLQGELFKGYRVVDQTTASAVARAVTFSLISISSSMKFRVVRLHCCVLQQC